MNTVKLSLIIILVVIDEDGGWHTAWVDPAGGCLGGQDLIHHKEKWLHIFKGMCPVLALNS